MLYHILFYDYVDGMGEKRAPHREAHLVKIRAAIDSGKIVLAGAVGDAEQPHGGVLVFAEGVAPAEIEAFAEADPYAQAGLLTGHRVVPWNVI